MNRTLLFSSLTLLSIASAQPPDTLWTRVLGGNGLQRPIGIRQSEDHGYIVGVSVSNTNSAGKVVRLDSTGNVVWNRDISLAGDLHGTPIDLVETSAGNIVLGGMNLDGDIYLAKMNSDGDTIWTRNYEFGSQHIPHQILVKIEPLDQDHVFLVAGIRPSTGERYCRVYVVIGNNGDTLMTHGGADGYCHWSTIYQVTTPYDACVNRLGHVLASDNWVAGGVDEFGNPWSSQANGITEFTSSGERIGGGYHGVANVGSNGHTPLITTTGRDNVCLYTDDSSDPTTLHFYEGVVRDTSIVIDFSPIDLAPHPQGIVTISGTNELAMNCITSAGELLWARIFVFPRPINPVALEKTLDSGHVVLALVNGGSSSDSDFVVIKTDPHHFVPAGESAANLPAALTLHPNYPNPFNPNTNITFDLPHAMIVSIVIYDLLGREVQVLVDEILSGGFHKLTFGGADLPSGIYLCRFKTDEVTHTQKLVLMK